MKAFKLLLAAGLYVVMNSPAHAEECVAGSTDVSGEWRYTTIIVDLASDAGLDPSALPARTSAVMCPRSSILPMPGDIRVLIEWRVAFGIAEEGPRSLWISSTAGRLQVTIDDGELNASEQAALDDWVAVAQARFTAAIRRPGETGPNDWPTVRFGSEMAGRIVGYK